MICKIQISSSVFWVITFFTSNMWLWLYFQISGSPSVVRKALYEISSRLHQHPRKENPPLEDIIHASTRSLYEPAGPVPPLPQSDTIWSHRRGGATSPMRWYDGYRNEPSAYAPGGYSNSRGGNSRETTEEFSMRILCATAKIGGVIGKSGVNVRQLEHQTGASIQVEDTDPEAEERVIIISSKEVGFWVNYKLSPKFDSYSDFILVVSL